MKRLFITGTDTGIGKTYVARILISYLVGQGHRVAAMKPIASGCESTADGLRNEDALILLNAINVDLTYEQVNPYAFEPPIAPHIAAFQSNQSVNLTKISEIADAISSDFTIIEGAGGWCVPINDSQMMVDLADALNAEVILVVGMKLGCINHALLSAGQIQRDGIKLLGWIANHIDPEMQSCAQNLETLTRLMPVPLLAEIPQNGCETCFSPEKLVFL